MPATYENIATTTLGSAQSSVTFSTIPGTYTDLVLICNFQTSTNAQQGFYIQFNSDTGNNYSTTNLVGNGSSASSNRASNGSFFRISGYVTGTADTFSNIAIANIMNYSNSTTYKTTIARSSIAPLGVGTNVGLWRSTSAITSFTLTGESQDLSSGSTFSLYGIKSF